MISNTIRERVCAYSRPRRQEPLDDGFGEHAGALGGDAMPASIAKLDASQDSAEIQTRHRSSTILGCARCERARAMVLNILAKRSSSIADRSSCLS